MSFCFQIVAFLVFSLTYLCRCQGLSSTCEEGGVFRVCYAEPQNLISAANVSVTVEPENMTCGTNESFFQPPGYDVSLLLLFGGGGFI